MVEASWSIGTLARSRLNVERVRTAEHDALRILHGWRSVAIVVRSMACSMYLPGNSLLQEEDSSQVAMTHVAMRTMA